MYCSTCGKSIQENLNYCNSCGARNQKNPLIVGNSSSKIMGVAGAFVGMVGLVCFVGLLKILLDSRLDTAAIIVILIAYLAAVFLLTAMMVGHVWKHSGDIRFKSKDRADEYEASNAFRGVNTTQLPEQRDFPASVTENTTRTLDKVPTSER